MRKLTTSALLCGMLLGASAHAALVRIADAEIRGTWQYDFDAGTQVLLGGDDVHWEQIDATSRALRIGISGGALLYAFGSVDFNAITESQLTALAYTADSLAGPPALGNALQVGDVFAVLTTESNYVKAVVTGYDNGSAGYPFYDLHIRYALYDGEPATDALPEPASAALLGLGLAGLAWQGRRRSQPGAS